MTVLEIILGSILIACALVLIAVVLLQDSKDRNTSSVITGGAEQLFGKSKGQQMSKKLNTITAVVAIVLVLVVLVFYLQQYVPKATPNGNGAETSGEVTDTVDTGDETGSPETGAPDTDEPADTGDAE